MLRHMQWLGALAGMVLMGMASAAPATSARSVATGQGWSLSTSDQALAEGFLRRMQDEGVIAARLAASDDAALIHDLLYSASNLRSGRVKPADINPLWALPASREDLSNGLLAALTDHRLPAWLDGLAPADPDYPRLLAARRRYSAFHDNGGWEPLGRLRLKPGEVGLNVLRLRARLAAEGYHEPSGAGSDLYDPALAGLVTGFQARHALKADGEVGPATAAALDVSATARLDAIDANLERMRWAPRIEGPQVVVDIGRAQLQLLRPSHPILAMRVIVGDPKHQTPLFASSLRAVILNPPWDVPASIAKAELWPKEAKSPGYLARNHIVLVDGRLRQAPGPSNSLGLLKFDMDSPFGVFLHDTPSRQLFDRDSRTLSHGCIRLQAPRELAVALLADQGWRPESLDQAIASGATQRIPLAVSIPVSLEYRTVWFDQDGEVVFGPDPYGWDRQLANALHHIP